MDIVTTALLDSVMEVTLVRLLKSPVQVMAEFTPPLIVRVVPPLRSTVAEPPITKSMPTVSVTPVAVNVPEMFKLLKVAVAPETANVADDCTVSWVVVPLVDAVRVQPLTIVCTAFLPTTMDDAPVIELRSPEQVTDPSTPPLNVKVAPVIVSVPPVIEKPCPTVSPVPVAVSVPPAIENAPVAVNN